MANASLSLHTLDICRPFFKKSGLNAFSYSRVFKDGSRCELWTDAAAFEHTFHKARYIVGAYTPQYFQKNERYSFLENKIESYPHELRDRYVHQLADQRKYFDHGNCFSVINRQEEFCEYFLFYSSTADRAAINFYLNHLDELEAFCEYFLQAAEHLISEAEKYRIPTTNRCAQTSRSKQETLAERMTSRERDVARLLITGATIKDVGIALSISPRTVESHVENMKIKYGCSRKSMLIKELFFSRNLFF